MVKVNPTNPEYKFDNLITAAQSENWDEVNNKLPLFCNRSEVIEWALGQGLVHLDGNVRDLAASTIEISDYSLKPEDSEKLRQALNKDDNPYTRFRAAFALFRRGDRSAEVMAKMNEALEDNDLKEIAKKYLRNNPEPKTSII